MERSCEIKVTGRSSCCDVSRCGFVFGTRGDCKGLKGSEGKTEVEEEEEEEEEEEGLEKRDREGEADEDEEEEEGEEGRGMEEVEGNLSPMILLRKLFFFVIIERSFEGSFTTIGLHLVSVFSSFV